MTLAALFRTPLQLMPCSNAKNCHNHLRSDWSNQLASSHKWQVPRLLFMPTTKKRCYTNLFVHKATVPAPNGCECKLRCLMNLFAEADITYCKSHHQPWNQMAQESAQWCSTWSQALCSAECVHQLWEPSRQMLKYLI